MYDRHINVCNAGWRLHCSCFGHPKPGKRFGKLTMLFSHILIQTYRTVSIWKLSMIPIIWQWPPLHIDYKYNIRAFTERSSFIKLNLLKPFANRRAVLKVLGLFSDREMFENSSSLKIQWKVFICIMKATVNWLHLYSESNENIQI